MLCLLLIFYKPIDKWKNKLYYLNSELIQKEAIGS